MNGGPGGGPPLTSPPDPRCAAAAKSADELFIPNLVGMNNDEVTKALSIYLLYSYCTSGNLYIISGAPLSVECTSDPALIDRVKEQQLPAGTHIEPLVTNSLGLTYYRQC